MAGIKDLVERYIKMYVRHEKKRAKRQKEPNLFFRQKDQMWFTLMNKIDNDVDEQGNLVSPQEKMEDDTNDR